MIQNIRTTWSILAVMTKDEANRLVNELDKIVGEPIRWRLQPKKHQRYRFSVRVIVPEFEGYLELTGTCSPSKWSYVLLGPNNERLRKISTPHPGHLHPDGSEARSHHKHYWDGDFEDWWTYSPDDIRWDNHDLALVDFVAECRIKLLHDPPTLAFQAEPGEG